MHLNRAELEGAFLSSSYGHNKEYQPQPGLLMRFLILLPVFALALSACSTTQKKETVTETIPSVVTPQPESSAIDYPALQNHLRLSRDKEALGFAEKSFNTCDAGFGYSRSQNCHQEHFVVIHFRLLCRDSEGTISQILTDADLRPLERRSVRWSMKGLQGTTQTDSDGYGQIVTAGRASQKSQRVRLAIGNEFLYMRAGELQKVITPRPWCNQY